jgi:hypothetical protein
MTQNTPIYAFPYPEPTDPPNGPGQFQAALIAVENVIARTDAASAMIVYSTPGTFSFTSVQAAGAKAIRVRCLGGGGGGGGTAIASTGQSGRGSGGGGGGLGESIFLVAALALPIAVVVGAGGTGGAGAVNGIIGGDSSFGATLVLGKGGAAGGGANVTTTFPSVTAAGTALVTGNIGQITMDGGVASPGLALSASVVQGGQAGNSAMGGTGQYPNTGNASADGRNATAGQGGGGGGACVIGPAAAVRTGGIGGSGLVVIELIY